MNIEEGLHSRHVDASIDAPQILRLYKQAWWANTRTITSTIEVVNGSSQALGIFNKEEQLVAFGRVVSDGLEKATIYDIIVDQSLHAKGLGTAMLQIIIESPLCQKVRHVELYCKEEMIPFYNKLKFEDISGEVRLLRLQK